MLARAACTPRVCLTCRLSRARRIPWVGVQLAPGHGDAARRRYASDSLNPEKKDVFSALAAGRRVDAPEKTKARSGKARQWKPGKGNKEDPFALAKEPDEVEEDTGGLDEPFDWRADPLESIEISKEPLRSASEPDEEFPEDSSPWEETTWEESTWDEPILKETMRTPRERNHHSGAFSREEAHFEEVSQFFEQSEDPEPAEAEKEKLSIKPEPLKNILPPRQFQDEFLRQQNLSIDALGERVNALIVKNPSRLGKKVSELAITSEPLPPISELDWKSVLPEQDNDVDAAKEAMRNIEELRPTETSVLPKVTFDGILDRLVDDFTGQQLHMYSTLRKSFEPKGTVASYAWLESQTEWKSSTPQSHENELRKQRLARRILATHWGIQIQEEVENPGTTTIVVSQAVFRLVTHPSIGVLEALQAEILDDSIGEAITTSSHARTIDIFTRKAAVPAILSRIHDLQEMVVTRSIPVKDLNSSSKRPDVLQELGRITRTIVVHNTQKAELEVSWIPDEGQPVNTGEKLEINEIPSESGPMEASRDRLVLTTEDPAGIVTRLLRGRSLQHMKTEEQIFSSKYRNLPDIKAAGMLVPHCRETRSMSWRDKLRQWERYVLPTGRHSKVPVKKIRLDTRAKAPPGIELREGEVNRLTATFGHILRSKPTSREKKNDAGLSTIISPVLPHPASFTAFVPENESELTKRSSIVLNFVPRDKSSLTNCTWDPEIKFTMPVDPSGDLAEFSVPEDSTLNLVNPWYAKDLLLPEESVDVRLSQESERPINFLVQDSFHDFLAASEFNLVAGQLRTPSATNFLIPQSWLGDGGMDTPSNADVPFMFAGLEIHQELHLAWKGYTLRYRSVEAGQHGGARAELALMTDKVGEPKPQEESSTEPTLHQEFMALVEEAVVGKHWSWHEGYKQASALPDAHDPIWKRITEPGISDGLAEEDTAADDDALFDGDTWAEEDENVDENGFIEDDEVLSEDAMVAGDFAYISEECEVALTIGNDLVDDIQGALAQPKEDLPEPSTSSPLISEECEAVLANGKDLADDVEGALAQPGGDVPGSSTPSPTERIKGVVDVDDAEVEASPQGDQGPSATQGGGITDDTSKP